MGAAGRPARTPRSSDRGGRRAEDSRTGCCLERSVHCPRVGGQGKAASMESTRRLHAAQPRKSSASPGTRTALAPLVHRLGLVRRDAGQGEKRAVRRGAVNFLPCQLDDAFKEADSFLKHGPLLDPGKRYRAVDWLLPNGKEQGATIIAEACCHDAAVRFNSSSHSSAHP
ncbi:hypothetical protein DFJ74DRAFT_694494 [Hyaloraphidium curvatum]|nr:hypothetical protein DFJ74DRAFT_694494 [Hyaloraphidium curvatum]